MARTKKAARLLGPRKPPQPKDSNLLQAIAEDQEAVPYASADDVARQMDILSQQLICLKISNASSGTTEDDWETSSISSGLSDLCAEYGGGVVPLEVLDNKLRLLHEIEGISFGKFKDVIKQKGICLKNCKEYGSIHQLRNVLWNSKKLLINREIAKQYKYVKQCLIEL